MISVGERRKEERERERASRWWTDTEGKSALIPLDWLILFVISIKDIRKVIIVIRLTLWMAQTFLDLILPGICKLSSNKRFGFPPERVPTEVVKISNWQPPLFFAVVLTAVYHK